MTQFDCGMLSKRGAPAYPMGSGSPEGVKSILREIPQEICINSLLQMSLSSSRWAAQKQPEDPKQQPSRPPQSSPVPAGSSTKYIPPNLRPKSTHGHGSPASHNVNNQTRKTSSSIIINASDRTLSKKFSSPQTNNQHDNSKLVGFINSFDHSLQLHPHPDPMSLVPSPSRGINKKPSSSKELTAGDQQRDNQPGSSCYEEQDLTKFEFQNEYFKWFLLKRLKPYRRFHQNQIKLFLHLSLKDYNKYEDTSINNDIDDGGMKESKKKMNQDCSESDLVGKEQFKSQVDQISSLVREIRKLREGIFAIGRRDSFAIIVYELSAELALESLDFPQLNTLLSTLILDLYGKVPITDHLNTKDESKIDSIERSSWTTSKEEEEGEKLEFATILTENRGSEEEIMDRRLMFSRVLLLLPIVTRFDLSRFLDQFPQICQLFMMDDDPHRCIPFDQYHERSSTPSQLLELKHLFKLLLRKNYARINRKFIKPKLEKIVQKVQMIEDHQDRLTKVQWDDALYLNLLNLIRSRLIWKSMEKSYYHLTLIDNLFIFHSLSLQFSSFDDFFYQSSPDNHDHDHVHQSVDHWLFIVNVQRTSNGTIRFKK